MLNIIKSIFGSANDRYLKTVESDVARINSLEPQMEAMSDDELKAQTAKFRERLDNGESLDDILHEAFATVREASKRVLKMRHYDVQLIGGMTLHKGKIAEMRTGEGKTLVATLPVYLNALTGKGVHVVTVNDYLASRDAEWMGRLYKWLGLTVGVIISDMPEDDRRRAYAADITYGTNNEYGFDYLRDNMKYSLDSYVQRDLHYAIIDEVDSILIDEARTPLIISGAAGMSTELPKRVQEFIPYLKKDEDYLVDEEHRSVSLTDLGVEKIERQMDIDNLYEPANIDVVQAVIKALQAHTLYKRDDRYMVKDGEIVIIDEFTGRPMPGRRWSDGLHQAIEAKEGVKVNDENQTLATVTFQNFFRMYEKLSGMTGTAETEAEEFHSIYGLDTIVIPTNKPIARLDQEDLVYRSYGEKFDAVVSEILDANANGQPVLVGTTSVEKSEAISRVLKKKGIDHNVLNAKQHEREANIVAQAGRLGAVTIATNMAGRGTDIMLGGNPEAMAEEEVGEQDVPETAVGDERFDFYTDEFKEALARYEAQCAAEKEKVLAAGGLFIIGTERHESRRIDNQLRGRAGRQGDPGRSRFFLSLEDDLLRLFGGDRIGKIMDTLKMEEGVPIEHKMVTRSLENAQKKVEGRNFDIRKNVLEYDDVMDQQRKTIYELRRTILRGEDDQGRSVQEMALDLFEEVALATIDSYANPQVRPEDWDLEAASVALQEVFGLEFDLDGISGREPLERTVWTTIKSHFDEKLEMTERIAKEVNEVRREEAQMQASASEAGDEDGGDWANSEPDEVETVTGREIFEEQVQNQYIQAIDKHWRLHLLGMEQLRDGIGMRGYAQKDPKKEYKKEGYNLFLDLLMNIKTQVVRFVSTFQLQSPRSIQQPKQPEVPKQIFLNRSDDGEARAASVDGTAAEDDEGTFVRELPKVGRNDPCPCGSGKKFKSCHLRKGGVEAALDAADDRADAAEALSS
jgi:preprotein translocase subunit SecA